MPNVRIPFTQPIQSRSASTTKDAKTVNGYFEKREGNQECVLRPGMVKQTITGTLAAGTAQGSYEWFGNLYVVVSNVLYKVTTGGVSSTVGSLVGTVQNVYWVESADHTYLFLHNGTNGYTLSAVGAFAKVDNTSLYSVTIATGGSGYTSPVATFSAPPSGTTATGTPVQVGGVIQSVTITNYGSGYVSAPTCTITDGGPGVNATASVTLKGFPSGAQALAAGAVYLDGYTVVATKAGLIYNSDIDTSSNPQFWNPINYTAAQADPDLIVGIVKHFNYICVFGEWGTEFFYDAATSPGSPFLRQDSYKNEIGCASGDSIKQFEQDVIFVGKAKTHGKGVYNFGAGVSPIKISTRYIDKYLNADTTSSIQAHVFKIAGHTFYVMSLTALDLTFVYDIDEREWYQWTSYYSAAEHYYQIWSCAEFNNAIWGLHPTNGNLYAISTSVGVDDVNSIYWRVVTNNMDSGSMKRKFYKSGEVVGDKASGTMTVYHSDDDFTTWSTGRTVSLSNTRGILYQLGQARRRAWMFLVVPTVPHRLAAFEVDIEGGEQERDPQIGQ